MPWWDDAKKRESYLGGVLGNYLGPLQDLANRHSQLAQMQQQQQQEQYLQLAQWQYQQMQGAWASDPTNPANMKKPVPVEQQEKLDRVKAAVEKAYATCREREEAAFLGAEELPNLAWLDKRVEEVRAW